MKLEHIFVYGSLRKAAATPMHAVMVQFCTHVADACIQGKLYEINGYPGAVESGEANDRVFGELYETSASAIVMKKLDEYEECTSAFAEPHEYVRKIVPVMVAGKGIVMACTYLFNRATAGLLHIESGDYPEFVNRSTVAS